MFFCDLFKKLFYKKQTNIKNIELEEKIIVSEIDNVKNHETDNKKNEDIDNLKIIEKDIGNNDNMSGKKENNRLQGSVPVVLAYKIKNERSKKKKKDNSPDIGEIIEENEEGVIEGLRDGDFVLGEDDRVIMALTF